MPTFAQRVIEVARSQVGVKEVGHNSGPEVDVYLHSVGLGPGYSWCGAFVNWVIAETVRQGGYDDLVGPPMFRGTAGALRTLVLNAMLRLDKPVWPCVYVLDHGGGEGHVGFGIEPLANGAFRDISGNTDGEGSREGDRVWEHTARLTANVRGWVRIG